MEYRIETTIEGLVNLKEGWKSIESQWSDLAFFSTYDYCFTWWENYQNESNLKLWVIVVIDNDKIVGIAPLIIETSKIRFGAQFDMIKFLANGDYHDFLLDKNVKRGTIYKIIFSVIEEFGHLWDKINLTHISQNSPLVNFLFKSEYNKSLYPLIENPYVQLNIHSEFEDFVKSNAPAKAKYYRNRLAKKVNYVFERNAITIADCAVVDIIEKMHVNNKGLVQRHSRFDDKLLTQFIGSLESQGHIDIYSLRDLDTDAVIIYNWGYVKNSVFYSVNTAYNPLYADYRVGRVMYYELFNYSYNTKQFIRLDCGTGRYPWKFEWTDDFNLLYQLILDKPRSGYLKKRHFIKKLVKRYLCN